jgi:hypothetical protein
VFAPARAGFNLQAASSVALSLSNRIVLIARHSGSLSVERLEQKVIGPAAGSGRVQDVALSRTIVGFQDGVLKVDARRLEEGSSFIIETPVGRIRLGQATAQLSIAFDPRSELFDFSFYCYGGGLQFTDRQGETYRLMSGQRLAGAGSSRTPSIEVSRSPSQALQDRDAFFEELERLGLPRESLDPYRAHFRPLDAPVAARPARPAASEETREAQARLIEHAVDPKPVTPFRGEVKPSAASRGEIF